VHVPQGKYKVVSGGYWKKTGRKGREGKGREGKGREGKERNGREGRKGRKKGM
jgi:hypothetical protein